MLCTRCRASPINIFRFLFTKGLFRCAINCRMAKHDHIRRRNVKNSRIASDIQNSKDPKWSKAKDKFIKKSVIVPVALILFLIVSVFSYVSYRNYLRSRIITPLDAPLITESPLQDMERFWGTYRPQLYFGLKARTPFSPLFGMMWIDQLNMKMPINIRHWCDQGHGLPQYGWTRHDGVNFGIQEIHDQDFSIKTYFVKRPGGQHGGDWSVRLSAKLRDFKKPAVISLIFYVALDNQGSIEPMLSKNFRILNGVKGRSMELGDFQLTFSRPGYPKTAKYDYLVSSASRLDKIQDAVASGMKVGTFGEGDRTAMYYQLSGRLVNKDVNLIAFQVTTELPYDMEIQFESGSFQNRPNILQGDVFDQTLSLHARNFDEKFDRIFQLESKGYDENKITFAKAALSNMIGGIGYFHGHSLVQSKYHVEEPVLYWGASLYTAVPSRSFFPRGFLWDEGFHNLLISQWDPEISKDIISHWLDLMNIEGWIPREQILGIEAMAKVPEEFLIQRNENANPPTLYLPIQRLIRKMLTSTDPADKRFLKLVFPRLKAWYLWYNVTQVGPKPGTYRWRGRDAKTQHELNPKTLTSGLDDYPRASHPTDDEYHVDLRCWMALASGIMADIAKNVGEDWKDYDQTHRILTDNSLLDELHWSDKKEQYSDYGFHSNKVKLEKPKPPPNLKPGHRPPNVDLQKVRVTVAEPKLQFVNAFGYVSLFPFLLKIVDPHSPKLFKILQDLKDPRLLWTPYGLRSLAKMSPLYNRYNTEHDPPYWRGPIWINMNYLALSALHHYSTESGPYQETAKSTYEELRTNIVENIIKEYERTGYIWENYNDKTGEGKGSHPFTGWSALTVLIMGEIY